MSKKTPDDPNGLIHEAFRIEAITTPECRTIFLDWALSLPADADQPAAARRLADRHAAPDHPMTAVLLEATRPAEAAGRRGGRRARVGGPD